MCKLERNQRYVGKLLFLHIENNGYSINALVDTGAQISVLKRSMLRIWKHREVPYFNRRLIGVTAENRVLGCAQGSVISAVACNVGSCGGGKVALSNATRNAVS